MSGTDINDAHKERTGFLKKSGIFINVMAILILSTLCIWLGTRLHSVQNELEMLQLQTKDALAFYDLYGSEYLGNGTIDGEYSEYTDMYTADSVAVSKRDKTAASSDEVGAGALSEDDVRKVYLTFDDGPSSNTGRILDILAEYDVKATFFVIGKEDEKYQALYNRIVDEGHTLGMHSYSHKYNEIYQSVDSYANDLSRLQEFLYETTGVWCRFCRFPGGSSNTTSGVDMHELIDYLNEQDITYFDWNISSGDATGGYISTDAILRNCLAGLNEYKTAVILMHDASDKNTTVEALPDLIERIQAMDDTIIVPITEDTELIQHISNE